MIGAIMGDIVGSPYEFRNIKTKDFPMFSNKCRFTDDTVMTIATMQWLLETDGNEDPSKCYREFARKYPDAGFGGKFKEWFMSDDMGPYGSWGNGSAMRVSPVGMWSQSFGEVLTLAQKSAECTHNHADAISGAKATAIGVYLFHNRQKLNADLTNKEYVCSEIYGAYGLDESTTLEDIRPTYKFDVSCKGTVPYAFLAFRQSNDYEDAIRNAVSLGGDCDTLTCITGALAEAHYTLPLEFLDQTLSYLPKEFISIIDKFYTEASKRHGN